MHFHRNHDDHYGHDFNDMRRHQDRLRAMRGMGGGGRGRRGKLFDSAQFQLLMLALIGDDERHGYELMRDIEARTGGAYAPSPGVVYPTLTLLADTGLIAETEAEGARKAYRVTDAGREKLAENAEQVEAILERLDAIGSRVEKADSAPVRRAMGNLRQVIFTKLTKSGTTEDQILEAARIIDEAAGRIERLK